MTFNVWFQKICTPPPWMVFWFGPFPRNPLGNSRFASCCPIGVGMAIFWNHTITVEKPLVGRVKLFGLF